MSFYVIMAFLCDYADAYISVTGNIIAVGVMQIQKLPLKIVIHLLSAKFI